MSVLALTVRPDMFVEWFWVEVSWGLGFSWRAYPKRFSAKPSYHCMVCMLILCAGTLDPWMH